ncbi:MAG: rod shape-determining protein MreC [Alphaproteobacteria bacterium]
MKQRTGSVLRFAAPLKAFVQRFAFLALVGASFGLMMLGKADMVLVERMRTVTTDAVAPLLDALSRPAAAVSEFAGRIQEAVALRSENARLHEENERLLQWQQVARRLEAENRTLRELLNVVPGATVSFVSARVIADSGGAFVRSVLVGSGARDGVRKGQAVITGHGLVGRVASVGEHSARILLITDLNSRIPVVVASTRDRAILAGDNSDRPGLVHYGNDARVSPGDRIVTSGHGGAFPPGLPVGTVASVSASEIRVQPYVHWDRLEYVRVVDFGLEGILAPPRLREEGG